MRSMTAEEILAIKSIEDLRDLTWGDIDDRLMTAPETNHIFRLCDSLWLHSGNPADPHAELTPGKCSNGFVDVLRTLCYTNLCELFAYQINLRLRRDIHSPRRWVVGSDHAGAAFSHSVAIWLNAKHDFTEKGPNKAQLWQRFTIEPDEVVIQVEELITTTSTLRAVREGIRKGNSKQPVNFAPFAATLVHRSNEYEIEGSPIIHLVHYDIDVWDGPETCPLCKQGSKRLRPKHSAEWAELTGKK